MFYYLLITIRNCSQIVLIINYYYNYNSNYILQQKYSSGIWMCISTVTTIFIHIYCGTHLYPTTSLLINCLLNVTYCRIHREKNPAPQPLPQLVLSIESLTDVAWSKTENTRIKTNIHSSAQVGIALCKLLIKWH